MSRRIAPSRDIIYCELVERRRNSGRLDENVAFLAGVPSHSRPRHLSSKMLGPPGMKKRCMTAGNPSTCCPRCMEQYHVGSRTPAPKACEAATLEHEMVARQLHDRAPNEEVEGRARRSYAIKTREEGGAANDGPRHDKPCSRTRPGHSSKGVSHREGPRRLSWRSSRHVPPSRTSRA